MAQTEELKARSLVPSGEKRRRNRDGWRSLSLAAHGLMEEEEECTKTTIPTKIIFYFISFPIYFTISYRLELLNNGLFRGSETTPLRVCDFAEGRKSRHLFPIVILTEICSFILEKIVKTSNYLRKRNNNIRRRN